MCFLTIKNRFNAFSVIGEVKIIGVTTSFAIIIFLYFFYISIFFKKFLCFSGKAAMTFDTITALIYLSLKKRDFIDMIEGEN